MLLSSALNSFRLCWHRSCEISAVTERLHLTSSIPIQTSPYTTSFFFHFKQNANVTLLVLRSGHISVHLTGLAIGQWWDYIFSLGLHFWSSQICWICICNSCVFVYTLMCLSASHTVMYISLLYLDINSWTLHKVPVVPLVTLDVLKSNFMLLHWPVPHCFDPHNSSTLCSTQQGSTSVWIYYLDTIHIHLR